MNNSNEAPHAENSTEHDDRIVVRIGTADEASEIIDLQNSIFNTSRTIEDWHWNNDQNPYYSNLNCVGTYDDKIVCCYSLIGTKLNLLGAPILAGQATNTIVHKDFRNLGYFQKSAELAVAQCHERNIQVGFGFPNEQALSLNLGKLRYKSIAVVKNYRYKLRLSKHQSVITRQFYTAMIGLKLWLNSQILEKWVPSGTTIRITDTVPPEYDSFWEQIRKQEILAIWKDSEYLQWRYDMNPRFRPKYFSCIENGKLTAMAVTMVHDGAGTISELLVTNNNLALAKLLINRICKHYLKSDQKAVKFYGHDRGLFEAAFSDFQRIPNQDLILIANLIYGDETLQKLIYQTISWSITSGDFSY